MDDGPLQQQLRQFDLERLDSDLFLGSPGPGTGRLFGGLIAAQAVVAAGRTVTQGYLHSLHSYFLRPGNHDSPVRYSVYRIRDGRTFTSRDVVAYQSGEAIFSMSSSFAIEEPGLDFQAPMPPTSPPEALRDLEAEWTLKHGDDEDREWLTRMPVEQRHGRLGGADPASGGQPWRAVWIRPRGTMPDDPLIHAALLAWISDDGLMSTVSWRDNPDGHSGMRASLDHAMWFHEPPCWNDWLLYRSSSEIGRNSRALIQGAMYTQAGRRVLSVTQEALIRSPRP